MLSKHKINVEGFEKQQINKSLSSWEAKNLMATVWKKEKDLSSVIKIYNSFVLHSKPNSQIFREIIYTCYQAGELATLVSFWNDMLLHTVLPDEFTCGLLINACSKIGRADIAQQIFVKMKNRQLSHLADPIKCTQLVRTFSRNSSYHQSVVDVINFMEQQRITLDSKAFTALFAACAEIGSVQLGEQLYTRLQRSGLETNIIMQNSILSMYAKCGHFSKAESMFNTMKKTVVSWNVMISAYAQHQRIQQAEHVFHQMKFELEPNHVTYMVLLKMYSDNRSTEKMVGLLAEMRQKRLADVIAWTALLALYAHQNNPEQVLTTLQQMEEEGVKPNDITFTTIISAFGKQGKLQEAVNFFRIMKEKKLAPTEATWNVLFTSCGEAKNLHEATRLHQEYIKSRDLVSTSTILCNSMISMYSKCNDLASAEKIFTDMNMDHRDVATWNAMLAAYNQHSKHDKALKLFEEMQQQNISMDAVTMVVIMDVHAALGNKQAVRDIFRQMQKYGVEPSKEAWTTLISLCGKHGTFDEALCYLEEMGQQGLTTATAWNTLLSSLINRKQYLKVLSHHQMMQQRGVVPDEITWMLLLKACAKVAALQLGKQLHSDLDRTPLGQSPTLRNSLINMYGKCGSIQDARTLFERIKVEDRDYVTWTAMLSCYGCHGDAAEALSYFEEMQKHEVKPDLVTFVSLLNACSHGGFVEESLRYLAEMKSKWNLLPNVQHYNCVVDALGRAGRLDEAEKFISKMEQPDIVTWKTLLGSCRIYGDVERGIRAANQALSIDPNDTSVYVLLANIYAAKGNFEDAQQTRKKMSDLGIFKQPGISWIEVNGAVHEFMVNDKSHPQAKRIYENLDRIYDQMNSNGYTPDTTFVLHDVSDEEKEHLLCYHSEKLAISFGLINTPPGTPLTIVKNLRMCGDCHSATAFISKLVGRAIFVRDAVRWHHFKAGKCSCNNYF